MAQFLAMRVAKHKLDYSDVPEEYKESVREILIFKYGWNEHDFD